MTAKQRWILQRAMHRQYIWVPLGFIAGYMGMLAPVHELGHILAAWPFGLRVVSMTWRSVRFDGPGNFYVAIAGYTFEHIVWMSLAAVWCIRWRRRGWFFYGMGLSPLWQWWRSSDRAALPGNMVLIGDVACVTIFMIGVTFHYKVMWHYNPNLMKALSYWRWRGVDSASTRPCRGIPQ